MMVVMNEGHLAAVKAFAASEGIKDRLEKALDFIDKFGCRIGTDGFGEPIYDKNRVRCEVYMDSVSQLSLFIRIKTKSKTHAGYDETGVMGCIYFEKDRDWSFHS